ncbi:cytochrome c oxidase subunit 6A1, mitochondrial-like [Leptopilina heterotoma]|uniref:cytochrome c oxidase subunit 6A1, mitochondrial-like n=1 Tax=Leptopilina heterotoma TaxID=63436 RepID=UPI001CA80E4A|nr:cytochrome c oxidase subunit 6A1, mitochondrial-like [Leptopilina heterotoma]
MASKLGRIVARQYSSFPLSHGNKESIRKTKNMWKMASLFIALPATVITGVINYYHHIQHETHRPEFIPYQHLRIRTKPFPWGDGNHGLFHNKKMNALPTGYEE